MIRLNENFPIKIERDERLINKEKEALTGENNNKENKVPSYIEVNHKNATSEIIYPFMDSVKDNILSSCQSIYNAMLICFLIFGGWMIYYHVFCGVGAI